jgi:hypothetical protein
MNHQRTPGADPVPGAGTLALLSLAWLLAMLASARRTIGDSPEASHLTLTRAALELPQVVPASLVAGVAVGLVTVDLAARYARRLPTGALARLATGAGGGLATGAGGGLATGAALAVPVVVGYGDLPGATAAAGTLIAATTAGGALAGVRPRAVSAAGVAAALGVSVVGTAAGAFDDRLRAVFGAGDSPASVLAASGWVVFTTALVAGLVAGGLGYTYLHRLSPQRRWPAYLVAGALPGLLALLSEALVQVGGAPLFALVSRASVDDRTVLAFLTTARVNHALIVLFTGALVAILLLGRTLRPADEVHATS